MRLDWRVYRRHHGVDEPLIIGLNLAVKSFFFSFVDFFCRPWYLIDQHTLGGAMKIASIVLFVLALASLALTTHALKSTKAQLARVQAQLADEVAHASALQHALQAERVANNEYLEKTKKADDTRDAFMRVARDLDVVPIDDSVRQSAIDAYKALICADSVDPRR